ncbi:MAG: DEAD/DEAH box helicase, partial [Nitrospirales bacterium]
VVQEEARPFQRLVANLKTQTLSPLQDSSGWKIFKELQESLETLSWENPSSMSHAPGQSRKPSGQRALTRLSSHVSFGLSNTTPLHIPLATFHALPLNLTKQDLQHKHLILKINGQNAPLQEFEQTKDVPSLNYRLNLFPDTDIRPSIPEKDLRYILRAECRLDETQCGTHEPTFRFFPILEKARDLPQSFKSQKRKAILRETFFRLLATQSSTEAHRVIKESLASSEFKMYIVKSEAKQLLTRFHTTFQEQDFRLAYDSKQWILFPHDKAQQAILYAIPFELFGHQIFRDISKHDEMTISHAVLQMRLPELHAALQTAGMTVFYHDKPILTSQWEFSFDAQRPPDIDWFEILPEIRCNGVVITDATWRDTLQHGSVMETEDGIRILDVNALEILRSLSTMYPADGPVKTKGTIIHVPTLQILDWMALRKRGVKVRLSEKDEALFQQLLNFEKIPQLKLPSNLKAKLRTYQRGGYHWLSFLYQHRFGACLADDMGLGKTLQAICLLAGIHEGLVTPSKPVSGPHLAVLPPSLLFNWEHEIKRFYPTLKIQWYNSADRSPTFNDCDIVLTTYGVVRRDIEILEKISFNVIIFDEAQAIKNIKAHSTGAARRLNGYFKLAMTGTPLENHLGEYYSLIDLSLPGLLGDYDEFKSQMKSHEPAMLEKLLQRTKPFVLRRTKSQILKELPPKIETDVYLDLTERQKALYQQTIASIRPTIEEAYRTKTAAQARVIALTAILKLRQVCLSPKLLNPTSTDASPKITCLLDRLYELMEEGHSALVFSQFTSFLDIVEQEFGSHSIPYARLDGSTPTKKRKLLVEEFQNSEKPTVFLLSLKAGGQGLNLTKASYVFHLDPWWNPAVENQASDRAHRIGQQQKVSIMRLLMHHTIEEKMMDLKKHKLALYEAVMEGSTQKGTGAGITKADFDFLLE